MPQLLNSPSFFRRRRPHATPGSGLFAAERCGARSGFTLVEVMVATMVFMMVILGVYSAITKAYQISQLTRYNDQARAVLLSYIDQFQRLETASSTGFRPFFNPAANTGVGLDNLNRINDSATIIESNSHADYISITLGDGTGEAPLSARVSRAVYPLNIATGALLDPNPAVTPFSTYNKQPGYSLVGVFTISYTLPSGKTYTQRLSTSRSIP